MRSAEPRLEASNEALSNTSPPYKPSIASSSVSTLGSAGYPCTESLTPANSSEAEEGSSDFGANKSRLGVIATAYRSTRN